MNEGSKDQTLAFKLLAFSKRLEACVAGVRGVRERGFWAREKREGRARKEGGKPPSSRAPCVSLAPKSPWEGGGGRG